MNVVPPSCVVIGAGDALGGAIARRFAKDGLTVFPVRRQAEKLASLCEDITKEGGRAIPIAADARREEEVVALFETAERQAGPLEVVVFNIGPNVSWPVLETDAKKYFKTWEIACFSGFLCVREAAKRLVKNGGGSILITGATASMRGIQDFSAFSGAKQGLRALAQSAAKELGPKKVHVAHVVIDGMSCPTNFVFQRSRRTIDATRGRTT